ncbi:MAG TPA: glycosyltransferase [Steroidobacteraceae bacterium]|nr:glycosyltransferase [Steroidobacteraceae bacterium]
MSSAPRLSIVVPTYNSAKYLGLTIDSLLAQTMPDFELILSDDASTDDTVKIGEAYAARDSRVKVVRNPHGGTAATRNAGLAATHPGSEFITFFDHDDLWDRNAALTLVAALDRHPEAPAAHFVCHCIDSAGLRIPGDDHSANMRNRRAIGKGGIERLPPTAPTSFEALLVQNYPTTPGTSMIRRSSFQKVGGYEAEVEPCDDWDMNLRISRLGGFAFIDEELLSWRRHSMATSNLSTRWRKAYMATRRRSIHAPTNTPVQRRAARSALRVEIMSLLKSSAGEVARGAFKSGAKKMARSLLLGSIYFG